MNQKNYEYLRDQVKFTGFGEGLENELKERVLNQSPQFLLFHQGAFGKDETIATLHFKKSGQSDMYFFNKYDLSLKQENRPEVLTRTFYINKGNNITLKEAYNLMNGRAVNKDLTNKEGQVYNAWVQLEMKAAGENGNYKIRQFHQNYGFDLEKSLSKLPIKELSNENDKTALLSSLHKGNRQAVTFVENGHEQRHFIEANPRFKSINIYNSDMHRIDTRQSMGEKQASGESNTAKESLKKEGQNAEKTEHEGAKQAKKRRRRQGQAIG